jgi:hypothetical protein
MLMYFYIVAIFYAKSNEDYVVVHLLITMQVICLP